MLNPLARAFGSLLLLPRAFVNSILSSGFRTVSPEIILVQSVCPGDPGNSEFQMCFKNDKKLKERDL